MTELVVRRLLVDMQSPIARHWCGGDAFRTAFFNALSMSFPVGEQFFIDSVRAGFQALPPEQQARFEHEIQGFVGQEATHRRLHGLFNEHLERQGLVNAWAPRSIERQKQLQGMDPRAGVAITAAYEHFTALLADWLLRHPQALGDTEPRLATMWLWHSAEESEHKSTAFDLYRALGGDHEWRVTWFRRITTVFLRDVIGQTLRNLWRDGSFWHWRTWTGAARFLFGREGLIRCVYRPWRAYLGADFHPSQQDSSEARRWLAEHRDEYTPVGAGA
jgi:uncharacterized protein